MLPSTITTLYLHTLQQFLSLSLSLSHTHTHTHTFSFSLINTFTYSFILSPTFSVSFAHKNKQFLCPVFSPFFHLIFPCEPINDIVVIAKVFSANWNSYHIDRNNKKTHQVMGDDILLHFLKTYFRNKQQPKLSRFFNCRFLH